LTKEKSQSRQRLLRGIYAREQAAKWRLIAQIRLEKLELSKLSSLKEELSRRAADMRKSTSCDCLLARRRPAAELSLSVSFNAACLRMSEDLLRQAANLSLIAEPWKWELGMLSAGLKKTSLRMEVVSGMLGRARKAHTRREWGVNADEIDDRLQARSIQEIAE